jgi:ribonuclease P protein component
VILVRPNGLEHARLGLAIARRQVPTAVARNRVKRVVRESFRLHRASLPPVDVVVMAQREAAKADRRAMAASLARHWTKIASCKAH